MTKTNEPNAKDIIRVTLESLGFRVREEKGIIPPDAKWVLEVSTPHPLNLKLRVAELKSEVVVFGIAIVLSEEHMRAYMELDESSKLRLASRLLLEMLKVCPFCRVSMQPSVNNVKTIVVEVHHYPSRSLNETLVADYIHRLVNVFFAVNAVLWDRFPLPSASSREGQIFM